LATRQQNNPRQQKTLYLPNVCVPRRTSWVEGFLGFSGDAEKLEKLKFLVEADCLVRLGSTILTLAAKGCQLIRGLL